MYIFLYEKIYLLRRGENSSKKALERMNSLHPQRGERGQKSRSLDTWTTWCQRPKAIKCCLLRVCELPGTNWVGVIIIPSTPIHENLFEIDVTVCKTFPYFSSVVCRKLSRPGITLERNDCLPNIFRSLLCLWDHRGKATSAPRRFDKTFEKLTINLNFIFNDISYKFFFFFFSLQAKTWPADFFRDKIAERKIGAVKLKPAMPSCKVQQIFMVEWKKPP